MCDNSQKLPPLNSLHDWQAAWLVIEPALFSCCLLLVKGPCKLCKFQELPEICEFFLLPESYERSSSTEQVNIEEIIIQLSTFLIFNFI